MQAIKGPEIHMVKQQYNNNNNKSLQMAESKHVALKAENYEFRKISVIIKG